MKGIKELLTAQKSRNRATKAIMTSWICRRGLVFGMTSTYPSLHSTSTQSGCRKVACRPMSWSFLKMLADLELIRKDRHPTRPSLSRRNREFFVLCAKPRNAVVSVRASHMEDQKYWAWWISIRQSRKSGSRPAYIVLARFLVDELPGHHVLDLNLLKAIVGGKQDGD